MIAESGPPHDPGVKAGPSLSIVVPAYNEGPTIAHTLTELTAHFPRAEVILVADGCTDDTSAAARSSVPEVVVMEYQPNRGKGYAVRRGMLAARGDVIVFTDADLPFGAAGVRRLLEEFARCPEADLVIAEKTGAYRSRGYRTARAVVRVGVRTALGLDQTDTQAGLKGFRRSAARVIFSQAVVDGFAADMEMLAIAAREGLRVAAVQMTVVNDTVRPSTFTPRQGLRLLSDVWAIRRRSRSGAAGGAGSR